MKKYTLLFYLVFACMPMVYAQFSVVSIPHTQEKKNYGTPRAQIHEREIEAIKLPFWDDFSFSNSDLYPHDTLWQFGQSVWLSNNMGINNPSLGAVVFDGLDSLGTPYNVNDILGKGIGDCLVSVPLKLDLVPTSERSSVVLSFYYQYQGHGEPPDQGDQLQVLFKNSEGLWQNVHTIENDGTLKPDVFLPVVVAVKGEDYFHANFQFKIQSYGRLSGPYDTWIVDYVYLNTKRSLTDTSYPDRTISTPLSSLFNEYWSVPISHFVADPLTYLKAPLLALHNLELIPGNTTQEDHQPLSYSSIDSIIVNEGENKRVYTHTLDESTVFGVIKPLEFSSKAIQTLPILSALSPTDSSVVVQLKLWVNTNDNVVDPNSNPPGDYNTIKYAPIDFRHNDTTKATFTLSDYYAYDDGTAEYGAGLNKAGARLAYQFDMKTKKIDTLSAIDIYFPSFGQDESQSIEIQILQDLDGQPGEVLHRETTIVEKNNQNQFWRHPLNQAVLVKERFYIGWKQNSNSTLIIGLDKNTDSKSKIFYNTSGSWEQNSNLLGSLMIRPVFGEGKNIITQINKDNARSEVILFPHPNSGSFTLLGNVQQVRLFDVMGKSVHVLIGKVSGGVKIDMSHPKSGIYILRFLSNREMITRRVVIE